MDIIIEVRFVTIQDKKPIELDVRFFLRTGDNIGTFVDSLMTSSVVRRIEIVRTKN